MNSILIIQPGAGGEDAQDWAKMLLRMYEKFCDKKNLKYKKVKDFVLEIQNAYQILKQEAGVHRLVRKSPFNAKGLRHTSFASVEILPEINPSTININAQDLRIENFRGSGPGGQHRNTTDSAVRITHLLTGITTTSQNQKSQHQNKDVALNNLKQELYALTEKTAKLKQAEFKTGKTPEWGNQIRSYILHPYKLVRDEITGKKYNNPDKILDGNLDLMRNLVCAKS